MSAKIEAQLFAEQDLTYQAFQQKLMPTVAPGTVIGVRIPTLRKLARTFSSDETDTFFCDLPHRYYEENILHGLLISALPNFDRVIRELDLFLPYVDNWAVCDVIRPKIFPEHCGKLLSPITRWMQSAHPYTIRFGIEQLMLHFLDDQFEPQYLDWVAALRSDEYYVNMMIAWFFATALATQYTATLPILQQQKLDVWTHNKTIQKRGRVTASHPRKRRNFRRSSALQRRMQHDTSDRERPDLSRQSVNARDRG